MNHELRSGDYGNLSHSYMLYRHAVHITSVFILCICASFMLSTGGPFLSSGSTSGSWFRSLIYFWGWVWSCTQDLFWVWVRTGRGGMLILISFALVLSQSFN